MKKIANPNKKTELPLRCVLFYLGEKKPDWKKAQTTMA